MYTNYVAMCTVGRTHWTDTTDILVILIHGWLICVVAIYNIATSSNQTFNVGLAISLPEIWNSLPNTVITIESTI